MRKLLDVIFNQMGYIKIGNQEFHGKDIQILVELEGNGKLIPVDVDTQSLVVQVHGDCQTVKTTNGDVDVKGDVYSVITTNGDVTASGDIGTVKTTNGDIYGDVKIDFKNN